MLEAVEPPKRGLTKETMASGSTDAGSKDLGAMVQDLQSALNEKLRAIKLEEDKVQRARTALNEEKEAIAALGTTSARGGDILRLNVGGRIFTTKRSTLTQVEGSLLEGMFSGRWDKSFDELDGAIFLDLDPDCFAEVLHQLRLLQLSHAPEVSWGRVAAPERREVYFRAMLDFLGLAKLPTFSPTFALFHPSVGRGDQESLITSSGDGHKWAIGATSMEAGTYMWGFKIHTLKNNHWIFLGVIASPRPVDNSYSDGTSYGWACSATSNQQGQAYAKGTNTPGHGGWSGFKEGDDVTMLLNVDSGVLRMKVARLQQTVFHFTGLEQAPWRVHVNLYSDGDCVELLSAGQF